MKKLFSILLVVTLLLVTMVVTAVAQTDTTAVVPAVTGGVIQFFKDNWALIASALFAVSEVLSLIPAIKANGVFQFIFNALKKAIK